MRKTIILFLLATLCFQACRPTTSNTKATEPLPPIEVLFETYHEERLRHFPLDATFAGDNRYNDILPNNITEAFRDSLRAFYNNYKKQLLRYDQTELSKNDKMSYDILMWECDINLEGLTFPAHFLPIDQFWTMQLTIGQFASGSSAQPFKTVQDYENWLKRLDAFTIWCDTAVVNMQKGIKTGFVLPKALVQKVIPQLEDLDHGPVIDHLFYGPIKLLPETFSEEDKSRLTKAYALAISNKIIPNYRKLSQFFKTEYLPACRISSGISNVPNGKAWYDHRIKEFTTTQMTADEIFELGKKEVARLLQEMENVKEEIGFAGDMKTFFDFVRNKKELMPFTEPQQVIDNFNTIHNKMKPQLARLFDLVPKTAFEVRRTEAFREKSASAEYNPGALDGSRPGIFYVPIPEVTKYNVFTDEDLFLHEAIPGHHYQISLQQENEFLPEFRRTLWYSAYGEGWALYCESLGEELGLYDDPYQYFGMLSAEMHRAIRLVVDAGMHAKGWTREQAIQYSLENEAESESSIISEIERYMALPGQALSYKIGQIKIRELRNKAAMELGDQFDIKTFHNKVLESGCLPLQILEDKINQWIADVII